MAASSIPAGKLRSAVPVGQAGASLMMLKIFGLEAVGVFGAAHLDAPLPGAVIETKRIADAQPAADSGERLRPDTRQADTMGVGC